MRRVIRPVLLALAVLALAGCTPSKGVSAAVHTASRPGPIFATTQVWSLSTPHGMPPECSSRHLQIKGATHVSADTVVWPVSNDGAPCSLRTGSVIARTSAGDQAGLALPAISGTRRAVVLAPYTQSWMGVSTNIRCGAATTPARADSMRISVRTSGGKTLGHIADDGPACHDAAFALWVAPYSESTSRAGAPLGLVAHLPTSSLRLKGNNLTAELAVINTTHSVYRFRHCPRISMVAVSRSQETVSTTAPACKEAPVVAKKSTTTFPIRLKVPSGTNLSDLNVGAYLSIGIGDDASLSRADAKPSPNSFLHK